MARVIAFTDLKGALLGVVRADPFDAGNGVTIQAVPIQASQQRHHIVEVADHLLGKTGKGVKELHREVQRLLPK